MRTRAIEIHFFFFLYFHLNLWELRANACKLFNFFYWIWIIIICKKKMFCILKLMQLNWMDAIQINVYNRLFWVKIQKFKLNKKIVEKKNCWTRLKSLKNFFLLIIFIRVNVCVRVNVSVRASESMKKKHC